jgi:hypothetical protein
MSNRTPWASGKLSAEIDGAGDATHITFPDIRASAPRLLLAAKGTANFSARRTNVDVDNPRSRRRQKRLDLRHIVGKGRRGKALRDAVVQFDHEAKQEAAPAVKRHTRSRLRARGFLGKQCADRHGIGCGDRGILRPGGMAVPRAWRLGGFDALDPRLRAHQSNAC